MSVMEKLFNALQWRIGMKRQELQLNRLENKMDFLLSRVCAMECGGTMRAGVIARTGYPAVFITDRNYFEPTLTAIHSLCRHADQHTHYRIHLILTDCSGKESSLAETLFPGIEVIESPPSRAFLPSGTHVTGAALLKFELPDILKDLDRVLYLDGDALVRKDLSSLFQIEFKDRYACAVPDCRPMHEKYPQTIGLHSGVYFNSGVLLMNLEKMRRDGIRDKLRGLRDSNPGLHFVDQDCFNLVLRDKILPLPLEYNLMLDNLSVDSISADELSELTGESRTDILRALADPVICHYGSPKPWNSPRVFHYGIYLEEKNSWECYRKLLDK